MARFGQKGLFFLMICFHHAFAYLFLFWFSFMFDDGFLGVRIEYVEEILLVLHI